MLIFCVKLIQKNNDQELFFHFRSCSFLEFIWLFRVMYLLVSHEAHKGTQRTQRTILENGIRSHRVILMIILIFFLFSMILIYKIFVAFVFLCELRAKPRDTSPDITLKITKKISSYEIIVFYLAVIFWPL
jgi:hypothetical protein